MQFTATISTSLLVIVLATMASASTIVDVKRDIITIDASIVNLYQHLQAPSPNAFTAFAAHQASNHLIADIRAGSTCISQLTEKPTDADAKLMLTTLGKTETKAKAVVNKMIAYYPKVTEMGGLKMATNTVLELQSQVKTFSEQLVRLAPMEEMGAAKQLGARFNADLTLCADVYTGKTSPEAAAKSNGGLAYNTEAGTTNVADQATTDATAQQA
ncbi:Cell wall galactomannoprotein [Kalmanozyma brasiliensis GHG001]|uniref:Cell wall protein n=1 Tax=Kalmanozyma brasiliensis (strain GHG001) TaxID=1365824 RepID=V5EXL6_KALBG|nr:Cell wall galactomannoprotein [Kalmanozyma brasiliensis GHG001]EST07244.1 Cell wall galactomannoprotein [Kalmanozyma brasiliensis GHG001]